jgi:hypothetical protein
MARGDAGGSSGITQDDFSLVETFDDTTAVLFAVASRPRRRFGGAG